MAREVTVAPDRVPPSPEGIMQMLEGYQVTAILRTALELGVFDLIAEGREDAVSIAAAAGADLRGIRILLDALAALGLLECKGGRYRLAPATDAFLVRDRPAFLGGLVKIFASEWEWEAFWHLPEAVRRGGSVKADSAETPLHPWWETFASSITGFAAPAAAALASLLAPWAAERQPLKVLDVACGNGAYSFALGRDHEHASLVLLDWPNVLWLTRSYAEEAGLLKRTRFIEGDMFEVALGGPYDLIIASHVFHHFSKERCLELLHRLAQALKPDGRLAIQDFMATDSNPTEEPFPRLFAVSMLVWTRGGETHPLSTYEGMLAETGFLRPTVHEVAGLPSRFLIAEQAEP